MKKFQVLFTDTRNAEVEGEKFGYTTDNNFVLILKEGQQVFLAPTHNILYIKEIA